MGPLLFLIYINDFVDDLSSNVNLLADDTSLFSIVQAKKRKYMYVCDYPTISAKKYRP